MRIATGLRVLDGLYYGLGDYYLDPDDPDPGWIENRIMRADMRHTKLVELNAPNLIIAGNLRIIWRSMGTLICRAAGVKLRVFEEEEGKA